MSGYLQVGYKFIILATTAEAIVLVEVLFLRLTLLTKIEHINI